MLPQDLGHADTLLYSSCHHHTLHLQPRGGIELYPCHTRASKGSLSPTASIAQRRTAQALHRPFDDVQRVLDDVHAERPFLCCLITYGCFDRTARRLLRWKDFSSDLSSISLAGDRNKSGRNRIVPVPPYVVEHLTSRALHTFFRALKDLQEETTQGSWKTGSLH